MKARLVPIALFLLFFSAITFSQAQPPSADKTPDAEQKPPVKKTSPDSTKAKSQDAAKPRSVMDRPLGEKPEPLVVPAGTEIRVDLVDGKVAVPVRAGFTTAIPALSKTVVRIDRVYAPAAYDANGNVLNNANSRYAEYGVLTAVTINSVTYKVETSSVPLATPGSAAVSVDNSMGSSVHDVKFVLSAPLLIAR